MDLHFAPFYYLAVVFHMIGRLNDHEYIKIAEVERELERNGEAEQGSVSRKATSGPEKIDRVPSGKATSKSNYIVM